MTEIVRLDDSIKNTLFWAQNYYSLEQYFSENLSNIWIYMLRTNSFVCKNEYFSLKN